MSANVNTFSNSASHPTYTSPSTGVLNQDQSIDIVSFSFQIHVDSLKHLVHLQAVYRLGPIKPPPVLPGSLGFRIPCQLFSITRFSFCTDGVVAGVKEGAVELGVRILAWPDDLEAAGDAMDV